MSWVSSTGPEFSPSSSTSSATSLLTTSPHQSPAPSPPSLSASLETPLSAGSHSPGIALRSPGCVVKSGFLSRQEDVTGSIKTWKKRWFVLTSERLTWYRKANVTEAPMGSTSLESIAEVKAFVSDKKFSFIVNTHDFTSLVLHATDAEGRDSWIKTISLASGFPVPRMAAAPPGPPPAKTSSPLPSPRSADAPASAGAHASLVAASIKRSIASPRTIPRGFLSQPASPLSASPPSPSNEYVELDGTDSQDAKVLTRSAFSNSAAGWCRGQPTTPLTKNRVGSPPPLPQGEASRRASMRQDSPGDALATTLSASPVDSKSPLKTSPGSVARLGPAPSSLTPVPETRKDTAERNRTSMPFLSKPSSYCSAEDLRSAAAVQQTLSGMDGDGWISAERPSSPLRTTPNPSFQDTEDVFPRTRVLSEKASRFRSVRVSQKDKERKAQFCVDGSSQGSSWLPSRVPIRMRTEQAHSLELLSRKEEGGTAVKPIPMVHKDTSSSLNSSPVQPSPTAAVQNAKHRRQGSMRSFETTVEGTFGATRQYVCEPSGEGLPPDATDESLLNFQRLFIKNPRRELTSSLSAEDLLGKAPAQPVSLPCRIMMQLLEPDGMHQYLYIFVEMWGNCPACMATLTVNAPVVDVVCPECRSIVGVALRTVWQPMLQTFAAPMYATRPKPHSWRSRISDVPVPAPLPCVAPVSAPDILRVRSVSATLAATQGLGVSISTSMGSRGTHSHTAQLGLVNLPLPSDAAGDLDVGPYLVISHGLQAPHCQHCGSPLERDALESLCVGQAAMLACPTCQGRIPVSPLPPAFIEHFEAFPALSHAIADALVIGCTESSRSPFAASSPSPSISPAPHSRERSPCVSRTQSKDLDVAAFLAHRKLRNLPRRWYLRLPLPTS